MTDKTLERRAREAAEHYVVLVEALSPPGTWVDRDACLEDFMFGYTNAATARDKEIEELREELAKVTEQRDAWPKYYGRATEGLMVLHDRKDLQDLSGLRCGEFMANAVPHLVEEIDRLRARVKELEGMVPRWAKASSDECRQLCIDGWVFMPGTMAMDGKCLMVPPIPLPEGK